MSPKVIRVLPISMVLGLLALSIPAHGQQGGGRPPGPCPSGSAPVNGSCGSPSNAGSYGSSPAQEVWQSRYGAIAISDHGEIIGTAKDQRSMRAAKKLALKKCVGPACKIVASYSNACGAVAWGPGNNGITTTGADADASIAEEEALQRCRIAGGGTCKTTGITCSLPVRVR